MKNILITITGFFLAILMLPPLVLLGVVFVIVCVLAQVAIKIRYGTSAYKANGTDLLHGKETVRCKAIIISVLQVQGRLDLKKIRNKMHEVITKTYNDDGTRRYRRLMELYEKRFGYNIWRKPLEEDFHIEDYVKEVHLEEFFVKGEVDECSKLKSSQETFEGYDFATAIKLMVEAFYDKAFPPNKAPWHLLLAQTNEQSFSVLFRFHHSIADGVYLLRFLYEDLFDDPLLIFPQRKPKHPLRRILTSLLSFCYLPFGLWRAVPTNAQNPLHGPTLSGTKKFYISNRVPLHRIQRIKVECGFKVSSNAIIFSCISYAISKLFKKRASQVSRLKTVVPLPMQSNTTQFALKNKFALGLMQFPVPTIGDQSQQDLLAIERLKMVQKTLDKMSRDPSIPALNFLLNGFCSIVPTAVAEPMLLSRGCTTAISRLPGPRTKAKLYGGILTDHIFWIPDRDPMGCSFGAIDYDGSLRISLLLDTALIHSGDEGYSIMEDFEAGFGNLLAEVKEQRKNESLINNQEDIDCVNLLI